MHLPYLVLRNKYLFSRLNHSMTMAQNIEFNKNEDKMMQLVGGLQHKLDKVYEGGGKSRVAKEHEKGKLTARERIDYLLDEVSHVLNYSFISFTVAVVSNSFNVPT